MASEFYKAFSIEVNNFLSDDWNSWGVLILIHGSLTVYIKSCIFVYTIILIILFN